MSMDSNYLKRYLFSFEGRATRLEYWMFNVAVFIGLIIVSIIGAVLGEESGNNYYLLVWIGLYLVFDSNPSEKMA